MIALFRRNPARTAAALAYRHVVEQARRPLFFTECGVPDTLDGRFELICLHAFLYLHRLKSEREPGAALGQNFFDAMFADFDRSLREMGTGDLSVGREVKQMAQAFYGRIRAYERGLGGGDAELRSALARNLYGTAAPTPDQVGAMAAYMRGEAARLGQQGTAELLAGTIVFSPAGACGGEDMTGPAPEFSRPEFSRPEFSRPEFSRIVPLVRIAAAPFDQEIMATPDECAALAVRFGLLALDRLSATVSLERQPDETILLRARFAAEFTQECVISLDPVAGSLAEQFTLRYGPPDAEPADDGGEIAFEPLDGDAIDIGEAVAQEFSLSLPPFPQIPGAVVEVEAEPEDDGRFAALGRLKDPPAQP